MTEEKQQKLNNDTAYKAKDGVSSDSTVESGTKEESATKEVVTNGGNRRKSISEGGASRRKTRRPRRSRHGERGGNEFEQKITSIRRVTRVMAGGRRFSFSVSMIIGNKKGKVGVGIGKASDTQLAIEKAVRDAKKNMITVPLDESNSIPHDVYTKYSSSEVMIIPAPGRGLVAGSSVRTVLELAGIKDVTAKLFSRSKNKLNNARAAVEALKQLRK